MIEIDLNNSPSQLWREVVREGRDAFRVHVEFLLSRSGSPDLQLFATLLAALPAGELRVGEHWQEPFDHFSDRFVSREEPHFLKINGLGALQYCLLTWDDAGIDLSAEVGLWLPDWIPELEAGSRDGAHATPHSDWRGAVEFLRYLRLAGGFRSVFLGQEGDWRPPIP